jgi:F-type H+-transporting ATPase subunit epsilon
MMNKNLLRLTIVSQEEQLLDQQVEAVTLLTENGEITILTDHQPILGKLRFGTLSYQVAGQKQEVVITQGFFNKNADNRLLVVVDSAFAARSENAAKIKEAIAKAQSALRLTTNKKELMMLEASLKQLFWELQLENKKKRA